MAAQYFQVKDRFIALEDDGIEKHVAGFDKHGKLMARYLATEEQYAKAKAGVEACGTEVKLADILAVRSRYQNRQKKSEFPD